MYNSILVPTDGSVCSMQAMAHAMKLASLCEAEVHFLFVAQTNYTVGMAEVDGFVGYANQLDEDVTQLGHNALAEAMDIAQRAGVVATSELSECIGTAADVISAAADKRDLVVMGGHGRSGLARVLLGSVSEAVIRQVHSPVLVVHCDEEA